jgi:hypothetical protein
MLKDKRQNLDVPNGSKVDNKIDYDDDDDDVFVCVCVCIVLCIQFVNC